jgi:hypothetical protein
LTVGGYVETAFEPSQIEFKIDQSTLPVTLRSLLVLNSLSETMSVPLTESGISMSIDSTTSQIWLPRDICDSLADALGLTFDSYTELYVVNSSIHQQLLQQNPQFTFTITAKSSSADSTNIVLPYAAFDLRASLPFYNVSTPYFPLRRAVNESQYTLGRTFLQEAYVVVDWERGNFTLGQVDHTDTQLSIRPIAPFERPDSSASSGLSTAVIAGIAVAGGIVIIVAIISVLLIRRRRRKAEEAVNASGDEDEQLPDYPQDRKSTDQEIQELKSDYSQRPELDGQSTPVPEAASTTIYELHESQLRHQLMSTRIYELEGNSSAQELEVKPGHKPGDRER